MSQNQNLFNEGTNFQQSTNDFPTLGGDQQQQQQQEQKPAEESNPFASNPFAASSGSTPFSFSATAFVPQGVNIVTEEEFPDLDSAFSKPQKKKQPTPDELKRKQEEENAALPTKGKPSSFFQVYYAPDGAPQMGFELEQFMYANFPTYMGAPWEMVQWLHDTAKGYEWQEMMKAQQDLVYNQGSSYTGGKKRGGYDEDIDTEESGFGQGVGKPKKKKGAQQQVQQAAPAKVPQKSIEKIKQQAEEQKVRKVKDVDVKVDEEKVVEIDSTRDPATLVFIGHVDAGKSTISGNIMYLMGEVDQRTIEKYKKEAKDKGRDSWWLAYVMDDSEEEKAKGKTVEVGRATFKTQSKIFTVLDAPGHKNYVPNMIMGASLADYAGLVISARRGEFESGFEKEGQTREHVQLVKSLNVQKLIVIVNKMDEPSVKWEKSRYDEIRAGLMPFLIATGYTENDVTFVPISGLAGDNILTRVTKETCSWYDGPTLMEILDKLPVEKRDPNGPLRIPIIDKMKDANQIIAHGKIESGTLTVGDRIQLAPYGHPCQVGGILDAQNQVVRLAKPGENVQVRLLHIDDESLLNRGNVICARDAPMPVSQLMEVDLQVLDLLEYKPIMSKGYSCMMHMHTFADECYIKDLIYTEEKDPASGSMIKKEMPKFIKSQTVARVRLATNVPVPLEKFETIPQLGRFTLRDEGKTIAVGTILRYKPHATEAQKAVAKAVASATKQLEETKIAEGGDKNKELVFNMETGTTSEKVVLAGIEEGEEDDD